MRQLLTLLFICSLIHLNAQNTMIDNSTVQHFDLNRYLGTWYEIARYDHSFERGLDDVTATYSMRSDRKIKVLNQGYKNGELSTANGKAKIPNLDTPSKLKVAFFLFFYADYYVMELDDEYQWAVIGSSSSQYLWILSRTPQFDESIYKDLIQRITERGYNTSQLIEVKHHR
jgi:apolipoprotein D and lipocalin family protein